LKVFGDIPYLGLMNLKRVTPLKEANANPGDWSIGRMKMPETEIAITKERLLKQCDLIFNQIQDSQKSGQFGFALLAVSGMREMLLMATIEHPGFDIGEMYSRFMSPLPPAESNEYYRGAKNFAVFLMQVRDSRNANI
jgi:hypothetical protein